MIDSGGGQYHFAPAQVTVQQGDTVRWLESSGAPHNVQFDRWPKGAKLGSSQMGPLLTSKGATYQLVIDGRFPAGTYAYECTPHGMLGMKAQLTVAP
ncbi:MAG TPA: plastocyanin/azurin family copper-binding protein [Longimicrobiales bacterium]